jgi:RNA polymerase sigma-70 factor (ECF subfamily)
MNSLQSPAFAARALTGRAHRGASFQTENEAMLKKLMLAGLAGDTAARRVLLDRLRDLLRTYFRLRLSRFGRDATEADDLVQDVLLIIHKRGGTYDPHRQLLPWVYTVARHRFIDHLRRTPVFRLSVPLDRAGQLAAGDTHVGVESGHDLRTLMDDLPEKMRCAIQCVKIDGLSTAEAARRCGTSESAVRTNVHRGLKRLTASIADGWQR